MTEVYEKLANRLGHKFSDIKLLKTALTHRSVTSSSNNERLEFLGDSIVNFIIADALYHRCPNEAEGRLTRLRANLVNGEELAAIARELELGDFLHLAAGEKKSGGKERSSILADAFEAVVAAIYLDAGMTICQEKILALFASRLTLDALSICSKDAKTALQEYLQARKYELPIYKTTRIEGDAHQQLFYILCTVSGLKQTTTGVGSTRRGAEQAAAEIFLASFLEITNDE